MTLIRFTASAMGRSRFALSPLAETLSTLMALERDTPMAGPAPGAPTLTVTRTCNGVAATPFDGGYWRWSPHRSGSPASTVSCLRTD